MEKRTRVVVCGSSLHMAGIQASLKAEPDLEVLCVDPHAPSAKQRLNELHPAAIVFDLTDSSLGLDVTLLRKQPGLLLIGVDPSSDEVLVQSSHPVQALSVADLVNVIRQPSRSILAEAPPSVFEWTNKHLISRMAVWVGHIWPGTRWHKVALVAGVIGMCLAGALALWLAGPRADVPLEGTAAGGQLPFEVVIAFIVGLLIGGVLIGIWLWAGAQKRKREP